jgi:amino acid adenylation domain-containing protein
LDQPLHRCWQAAAKQFAERVAVFGRTETWRYRDLDRYSRRVAQAVWTRLGAGHEPVALLCHQDAPGLAALWGILGAGKFYVPLDLAFPPARMRAVLDDLGTRLVVAERATLPLIARLGLDPAQLLVVDDLLAEGDAAAAGELDSPFAPTPNVPMEAPAYIIFTSGTTGAPKGVIETHRNVTRFTQYSIDAWRLGPQDVHLMMTSLSFSATATLIFPTLFVGGAIRCVDVPRDGAGALAAALTAGDLTVASIPPAVLRILPDLLGHVPSVPTLRQVRLGGDTILARDLAVVRKLSPPHCVVRVGYGLSELKYAVGFHLDHATVLPGAAMPGGFAVDYVQVEVHDDLGNRLGPEEVGELVLYSDYLSPGYWRRPELDAVKYGVDADGRRFYRSGDLGRTDAEGCVWILGRRDGQLKIRGQRVEIAEIEVALNALPGVREALVVARTRSEGEAELVAYVVPATPGAWDGAGLRRRLAERLPDYMIPVAIGLLDEFPRNTNHKPDRSRLPAIETLLAHDGASLPPVTPVEQVLAQWVGELLGRSAVGRHENFFELGGHSLLAARLCAQIRRRFGVDLPLRLLLTGPTVAEMAQAIAEAEAGHLPVSPLCLLVQAGEAVHSPLFLCLGGGGSETELLWYAALLHRLEPAQPIYALLGRGTDGRGEGHASVAAMLDDYLAALRHHQPHGPYLLSGECIGAKLAFLLAQRLEADGEEVALLLLLDATRPTPDPRRRALRPQRRLHYHWDHVRRLGLHEGSIYLWQRVVARLPGATWGDATVRRSLAARSHYRRLVGEVAVDGLVCAPTILVASAESRRLGVPQAWQPFLAGPVEVEPVPGDHRSYLGVHVDATGDAARRQLAHAAQVVRVNRS